MKRICIVLQVLLLSLISCSQNQSGFIDDTVRNEQRERAELDRKIRLMVRDDNYYWGEGMADIVDGRYSEARREARERAMNNLAAGIRTRVIYTIKSTITGTTTQRQHTYSETEERMIEETGQHLTDEVLSDLDFIEFYDDFPRDNVITCIVRLSRSRYQQEVEERLNDNKSMVSSHITLGDREFQTNNIMNALHYWTLAKEMMQSMFGNLPIFQDITGDGSEEDFNSYLNERITETLSHIKLELADDDQITYDAHGNIGMRPVILAQYEDRDGRRFPVASLPLKINETQGQVRLPSDIMTRSHGQLELNISNIDASFVNTVLRAEIDTYRIDRINLFSLPVMPTLDISMSRMKTMAVSVTLDDRGNLSTPNSLLNSIRRRIINSGLSIVDLEIRSESFSSADINTINRSNADYFVNVFLEISGVGSVGGYENAHVAYCSGSINVYRLPGVDNTISSEPVPAERGYGTSASSAISNALANASQKVERQIRSILDDI